MRRRGVLQGHHHRGQAWTGIGFRPVVVLEFLHPLFERIRHEVLHLLRGGAWPCGNNGECFHREWRIFGTSQAEVRKHPDRGEGDDQEQRDGSFADGERGKIEAFHCIAACSVAARTRSPSCR